MTAGSAVVGTHEELLSDPEYVALVTAYEDEPFEEEPRTGWSTGVDTRPAGVAREHHRPGPPGRRRVAGRQGHWRCSAPV